MKLERARDAQEVFFKRLRDCSNSILVLDYDGTIAPYVANRAEALPHPRLLEQLNAIQATDRCRLIIISGRSLEELISLVGLDPFPEVWGSHGLEHRSIEGVICRYELPSEAHEALERESTELSKIWDTSILERKPFSLAVHWRGKDAAEAISIESLARQRWKHLFCQGLEIHPFNCGLELRPKGIGKGDAVKKILVGKQEEIPIAYIGDDLTDEDAFREMGDHGLKVLLRNHQQSTLADIEVTSMEQLVHFFDRWIQESKL